MKHKLIFSVLAIIICVVFATNSSYAAESISAYLGYSREVNEAIAKNVEENLGIEIKHISLSWGEIWARVQTEKPNFNADMVISYGAAQAITGKKQGIYECFIAPSWADIDPVFKDPDGCWYALGTFSFILVGNKEKLAEKGWGMPVSWKDLLNPKWKGQIVAPSPRTSGTAFMLNYSFLQLYGEKEGWKFLADLDKNIAFYTKSGNAPTDLVGRGEYLLGITADENVLNRIQQGYPLQWTIPVEGIGYEGNYTVILKGTKKLEQSKKIMDYFGTQQFSEFLASFGYFPPRPGIASALYGAAKPKYINIDHSWAVKNRSRIIKTWKSKFLMKETPKAKKVGDEKEKKAAEAAKKQ
jgi:iron(III) transport system substrate-binding protein